MDNILCQRGNLSVFRIGDDRYIQASCKFTVVHTIVISRCMAKIFSFIRIVVRSRSGIKEQLGASEPVMDGEKTRIEAQAPNCSFTPDLER